MEFEMDTSETKNPIRPEGPGVEYIIRRPSPQSNTKQPQRSPGLKGLQRYRTAIFTSIQNHTTCILYVTEYAYSIHIFGAGFKISWAAVAFVRIPEFDCFAGISNYDGIYSMCYY